MGRASDSAKIELWRERLVRFESSGKTGAGLTVAEFCRVEQISLPSFYQWRRRFRLEREGDGESQTEQVAGLNGKLNGGKPAFFVGVRLQQFSQVEVELVNGVSLRLPAGDLESLKAAILIAGQLPTQGNRLSHDPRVGQRAVRSC